MFLGEKIAFFRKMHGMTQKILGLKMGLSPQNADARIAQYECGARTPKPEMIRSFALALGVSPYALRVPDSQDVMLLMHILFDWEDSFGLHVQMIDGKPHLAIEDTETPNRQLFTYLLTEWYEQYEKYRSGEMLQDEYDEWRYLYPMFDTNVHMPSKKALDHWFDTVEAYKEAESKKKKSKARKKATEEIHSGTTSFNEEYIASQQSAGLIPMTDETDNSDSPAESLPDDESGAKKPKRYKVIRGFKK